MRFATAIVDPNRAIANAASSRLAPRSAEFGPEGTGTDPRFAVTASRLDAEAPQDGLKGEGTQKRW